MFTPLKEREANVFSTYWQAKDMVFRWKCKAKLLCVMADFLQGDRQTDMQCDAPSGSI